MAIVQCVPNISEGRDEKKIEAIVEPLKNQKGFSLVGYEPDKDYNRTVITLIGDPSSMHEPILKFIEKAHELIDMRLHEGEHPRMGAVDVLPFIPIEDIDMEECKNIAEEMGNAVSKRFNIPVFLYGEAAKTKSRKRLPNIRKGEFEAMKEKIKETQWAPDYGPSAIDETFGVLAIGARLPLIAYNIDLNTQDMDVAKRIARSIRGSSGGFKHIQAGPVFLSERGHAQVTMNILNYKQNPIYRVLETVKMEAARDQVEVPSSEIVGLVPKDALVRSINYYMKRDRMTMNDSADYDTLAHYATNILGFRDFTKAKIIEANIE